MKTVRFALAMAVALSIAIPMMAQEKKAGGGKRAQLSPIARVMLRMSKLREAMEEIDLTAEQKEKLGKAREELGPKMREAFGELAEVLTEEQKTAAEAAAKEARDAGKEGRNLMLAVEASLKLTAEQKEKADKVATETLIPLSREMTKKTLAVLTPEQREKVKKALAPKGRKPAAEKKAD